MQQHEYNSSNDSLIRENKVLKDKVKNMDNKIQELNIEIQEGYKINKKLESKNNDHIEQNERLTKENELLKKSKAQKEKYIAVLLKEKEKMLESTNNHGIKSQIKPNSKFKAIDTNIQKDDSNEREYSLKIEHLDKSDDKRKKNNRDNGNRTSNY